jgi:hypothetical protein
MDDAVPGARHGAQIGFQEHHQQGNVQRWRLVVGLVEAHQESEQPAEGAGHRATLESAAQREEEKAAHGDQLAGQQAPGVGVQLAPRRAQEQRNPVKRGRSASSGTIVHGSSGMWAFPGERGWTPTSDPLNR